MNRRNVFWTVGMASVVALSACSPLSPILRLDATPPSSVAHVGANTEVALDVRDARNGAAIGTVPGVRGGPDQPVTAVVPPADVLRDRIRDGLLAAGFRVETTPQADTPRLTVTIERLDYKLTHGTASWEIAGHGRLSAEAKNGPTTRTGTYSVENGKKWAITPPPRAPEQYVNALLTDLLAALLNDQKLLTSLATGR